MSDPSEKIVSMALVALPEDRVPTEEEIRDTVGRLAGVFGLDDAARSRVLQTVLAKRLVKMEKGYALKERHTPWVDARRPRIDPFYWSRFKLLLQKEFAPGVISGFDRTTDEILDLMGDPEETDTWKRRGLVMGEVQSGKTAAYSALICKAADAGYRFIVLLTGTIENLRRQNQRRLDRAFVGFDSSEQLKRNGRSLRVGVGLLDGRRQATIFTSSAADFRASTLETLGLGLAALSEPALVVVKKHARILANIRDWLRSYNAAAQKDGIDFPMLMIDDEADNASINTNDPGNDPTAVNAGIRELLTLFRRTTYVGFTATPFANIFVNPESDREMLGDDLFPRHFIYTLQAASNYFGPQRVFADDDGERRFLRAVSDVEGWLPSRHRADRTVEGLPDSLVDALCAFLVGNAIRDLRGEGKTHRSMLVNVTHFTRVQDQVEGLIHSRLDRIKTAVRNHGGMPPSTALQDPDIRKVHSAWRQEYQDCGFDWPSIQSALREAVLPVSTIAVNQRTGPRALDYDAHKENGLRVVAVGGNSLSRGLTLEGLMASYFRRSSSMYDTLLQMGRWFGYRPGYEDLCRIWLQRDAIDWYGHISDATDELRDDLRLMLRLDRTPEDFGLKVRAHPDSLAITARNKMRTARDLVRVISPSAQLFESVELPSSAPQLIENYRRVSDFARTLTSRVGAGDSRSTPRLLRGATRLEVAELLRCFSVPQPALLFQPDSLADLLGRLGGDTLSEWDVAVPSGKGAEVDLGGMKIRCQERSMRLVKPMGAWVVSGGKRRVGSRGVEKAGLTPEQVSAAEDAARRAAEEEAARAGTAPPLQINVADRFYRQHRSRPLLLLHVLEGTPEDNADTLPEIPGAAFVALGLSFPVLADDSEARRVTYKINLVKAKELYSAPDDDADDDDAGEEEP